MRTLQNFSRAFLVCIALSFSSSAIAIHAAEEASGHSYADLVKLFREFREFASPKAVDGVPDYRAAAMERQKLGLKEYQNRLTAIDPSGWPIPQQVDYHIVRAEMNGLEFYQRVLRPWSRDPCFYSIQPGMSDPWLLDRGFQMAGELPLSAEQIAELRRKFRAVPKIFEQAKENLAEAAGDLALLALHFLPQESALLEELANHLAGHHPELAADAKRAQTAVDDYRGWLIANKGKMTASAGIGVENYNWWLKNVHLFPYTWKECRDIVEREDNRVITFLRLEENRNRKLPPLEPASSQQEYKNSVEEALQHLMNFIHDEEIFTVPDYLKIENYWEDRKQAFEKPWPKIHDYFDYFALREPLPSETHESIGHDFEWQRLANDSRPIRGVRRLYFIEWIRDEGWAFALEELLMHAGYMDDRPRRGREIVYQQAAFRTCRALADLRMHSQEISLQEAMRFCVECAPRGDLLDDSPHLWHEMRTTLCIPGWHMGMVVGKAQFMKLFRDRARQLGDDFNLKEFMDEFLAAGMIPMSLIRWEMTGYDDEIKKLW